MNIAKTSTKSSAKSSEAPKGAQAKPRSVELLREPVELYKVLKFEGLVASGGEAKAAIDAGLVFVNDKVEMQKRKKLVNGDTVRMGDESLLLTLVEGYDPTAEPVKRKLKSRRRSPLLKKTGAESARQLRSTPTQAWCQIESLRYRREALKAARRVQRLAR